MTGQIEHIKALLAELPERYELWFDAERRSIQIGRWPYGRTLGADDVGDISILTLFAQLQTFLPALLDVAEAAQEWQDATSQDDELKAAWKVEQALRKISAPAGEIPQKSDET